jgi:hypothetical protein
LQAEVRLSWPVLAVLRRVPALLLHRLFADHSGTPDFLSVSNTIG